MRSSCRRLSSANPSVVKRAKRFGHVEELCRIGVEPGMARANLGEGAGQTEGGFDGLRVATEDGPPGPANGLAGCVGIVPEVEYEAVAERRFEEDGGAGVFTPGEVRTGDGDVNDARVPIRPAFPIDGGLPPFRSTWREGSPT